MPGLTPKQKVRHVKTEFGVRIFFFLLFISTIFLSVQHPMSNFFHGIRTLVIVAMVVSIVMKGVELRRLQKQQSVDLQRPA